MICCLHGYYTRVVNIAPYRCLSARGDSLGFAGAPRTSDYGRCVRIGERAQPSSATNFQAALVLLLFLILVVASATAEAGPASGAGSLSLPDALKAIGVGVLAGVILSGLIVATSKTGVSPLPKPLCVAFMEAALHQPLTLASGLAFHVLWVVFWSFYYVFLFWNDLTLIAAFGFALVLWLLAMLFFFPAVGWGFFGRKVGALSVVDSIVSHSLFAVVIWALNRWVFGLRPI